MNKGVDPTRIPRYCHTLNQYKWTLEDWFLLSYYKITFIVFFVLRHKVTFEDVFPSFCLNSKKPQSLFWIFQIFRLCLKYFDSSLLKKSFNSSIEFPYNIIYTFNKLFKIRMWKLWSYPKTRWIDQSSSKTAHFLYK